jgi:hypothetical protein
MSKINDNIENEDFSDSSNSEIEINDKPKKERKVRSDKKEKPPKKEYVLTEKRNENILKARLAREIKVAEKKKLEEEMNQVYLHEKKKLEAKKIMKLKAKQQKEITKLKQDVNEISGEEEEEIIIMKKPSKKKIYYEKPVEKPIEKPIEKPPVKQEYPTTQSKRHLIYF